MNGAPTIPPAGLIDWRDIRIGGMPAFERALRALEAGYLELNDRHAAHLAEHHRTDRAVPRALADMLSGEGS